jgi:hypothetical protein
LLSLGATTHLFTDPFDDPSRWSTDTLDGGLVAYSDGALSILVTEPGTLLVSMRGLPEPVPVLRVAATVTLSDGAGAVGVGCGTGGERPDLLVGEVTTRDTWRLATVVDGARTPVAEGPLPLSVDLSSGGTVDLALECAATGTDAGDRAALWVDGQVVGDAMSAPAIGAWERAVLLATVDEPALIAFFDDALVDAGSTYAPVDADPAVLDLLSHVPTAWRDACTALRPGGSEALVAGVVCSPAGEAAQAEYYRYATAEALDAAFVARLEAAGGQALDAGDCSVGPSVLGWSVPGGSEGRIACFENRDSLGGLQVVWTDTRLGILALGVRTEVGYGDLYDWWLGAGPDA